MWVRWGWVSALHWSGLLRLAKRRLAAQQSVIVLTFHRVLPDPEFEKTYSPPGMVMRERTFEETLRYVSRQHIPIELEGRRESQTMDSGKLRLAFTFDDGWLDNARYAAPIARKYGVPLTIFLCPGRMGAPFPFWPERITAICEGASKGGFLDQVVELVSTWTGREISANDAGNAKNVSTRMIDLLKSIPSAQRKEILAKLYKTFAQNANAEISEMHSTMTWEDVLELGRAGVNFGSHTNTHQILTMLPSHAIERELRESKQAIEERLSRPCAAFAYPNGNWSFEARALVAKAGYTLAFQNSPGAWTRESDPLLLPRVNIWEGKVLDPRGRFSPVAFDYSVFWRVFWHQRKAPKRPLREALTGEQPAPARADSTH